MNKIIIHIGARKNSSGVKNKNIKQLLGKPLIQHSIEHAKKINKTYKIVVSSDSKKILNISRRLNVDVQILRPSSLANSTASKFSVWQHSIKFLLKKNIMTKNDIFLDLDCTCPTRDIKDIKLIIKKFIKYKKNKKIFDGVFSVTKARKNPYFNLVEYDKNDYLALSKTTKSNIFSRQKCPEVYEHVASIYCLERNFVKKKSYLYEGKIKGYLMKEFQSFDVDNKFDFEIVNFLYKKHKF